MHRMPLQQGLSTVIRFADSCQNRLEGGAQGYGYFQAVNNTRFVECLPKVPNDGPLSDEVDLTSQQVTHVGEQQEPVRVR